MRLVVGGGWSCRKEATQALIHMKVHHQLHNQAMLYVACTVNDRSGRQAGMEWLSGLG